MKPGTKWTRREDKTLAIRFNDGLDDTQIARELGRTSAAVRQRRHKLRMYVTKKRETQVPQVATAPIKKVTVKKNQPKKTVRWFWGALEITKF